MFKNYIFQKSPAQFNNKILIVERDGISSITDYTKAFEDDGFEVIRYEDDVHFRLQYESRFRNPDEKLLIITDGKAYIPYDVRKSFHKYEVSFDVLFPKLNAHVLQKQQQLDYDLLTFAYECNFKNMSSEAVTIEFLESGMYTCAEEYLEVISGRLTDDALNARTYRDWFSISDKKARADIIAAGQGISVDFSILDKTFGNYVLEHYGKLSTEISSESPVLVSSAMGFMHDNSSKFAVIVMDGMSAFDWSVIKNSFDGIRYSEEKTMAMIPTTTSISRQCLLSNKYPVQLEKPWVQSNEKNEFVACAKELGFAESQIAYVRGYDVDMDMATRCCAVIINDIDDLVHSEKQGRAGMMRNVKFLSESGRLAGLTRKLLKQGFDVYITADHGNAPSTGLGLMKNAGVDVETKSRKFLVLKDYADKDKWKNKYKMIEYPKYYLPKDYDYLICDAGKSMDINGESVMTHGGISIDEVIVPFIKIKAEENK